MKDKFVWDDNTVDLNEEKIDENEQTLDLKKDTLNLKVESEVRKNKKYTNRNLQIILRKFAAAVIFATGLILLIFYPFFSIESITYSENHFISNEKIDEITGLKKGENFSIYKYIKSQIRVQLTDSVKLSERYSVKSKSLTIKATELKPLLKDKQGNIYAQEEARIVKIEDKKYNVPLLGEFEQKDIDKLCNEMKEIDYSIIKEISYIAPGDQKKDQIIMQMKDGNYVEINIEQISEKMPYYLQISSKLKQEKAKPGIIHLDIGDYYESFE